MKALSVLFAAAALFALPLAGQEKAPAPSMPANPSTPAAAAAGPASAHPDPSLDLVPAAPGQIMPPPASAEPSLIPDSPAAIYRERDKLAKAAVTAKTQTEIAVDALLAKVRFREARTRALADPAFAEELHRARTAKTEFAKREAYKRYYTAVYDRIAKIDPRVKDLVDLRKKFELHRLEQHKVSHTVGLDRDKRPDEWSSDRVMYSLDPFTPADGLPF
jgi:hypothetical protein